MRVLGNRGHQLFCSIESSHVDAQAGCKHAALQEAMMPAVHTGMHGRNSQGRFVLNDSIIPCTLDQPSKSLQRGQDLSPEICSSAAGADEHGWRIAGHPGNHQRWPAPGPYQLMGLVAVHPNCSLPDLRPHCVQHICQRQTSQL